MKNCTVLLCAINEAFHLLPRERISVKSAALHKFSRYHETLLKKAA